MSVTRLSESGLKKLLDGEVEHSPFSVVKFYSNGCHLCKNLSDYYHDIANGYEDEEGVYFFAFNIEDSEQLKKQLKIDGVPTILTITSNGTIQKPSISVLPEPDRPNPHTWYYAGDIKAFIEKER